MKIKEIVSYLERIAPRAYQESYDNSGLICGDIHMDFAKAIICLDSIEAVLDEAILLGANLIIAHHPIVFKGLKSLTGKTYIERVVIKAIKNDIAIYAIHTNLDHVLNGVNKKIAEKLSLSNPKILAPKKNTLSKLVFFSPPENTEDIKNALFEGGAGVVGNYSEASFDTQGLGSFKGNENAKPTIGQILKREQINEVRTEMIFPTYRADQLLNILRNKHPYEEVAYDMIGLANTQQDVGAGMIGELDQVLPVEDFLELLKNVFQCTCIRHTNLVHKCIKKVAVCGGSGSFLLSDAIRQQADIFITGDFKYHEFFDAEDKIIIADIGHFESEQYTNELLYEKLTKKFPTFAFLLTRLDTNPVKYFT